MLTVPPFDPTLGRGVIFGPLGPGAGTSLSDASAVAAQPDGKVVVVGVRYDPAGSSSATLAARRYNADGTPDATFGTRGEADIPLPAGSAAVTAGPQNLVFGRDGSIVFAAAMVDEIPPGVIMAGGDPGGESVAVRLTADGRLNPAFGNGGIAVLARYAILTEVAVRDDGSVVASGRTGFGLPSLPQCIEVRLTAAGAPDSGPGLTTGVGSIPGTPSLGMTSGPTQSPPTILPHVPAASTPDGEIETTARPSPPVTTPTVAPSRAPTAATSPTFVAPSSPMVASTRAATTTATMPATETLSVSAPSSAGTALRHSQTASHLRRSASHTAPHPAPVHPAAHPSAARARAGLAASPAHHGSARPSIAKRRVGRD